MSTKAEVKHGVRFTDQKSLVGWREWIDDLPNWTDDEITSTWRESRNNLTGQIYALWEMYALAGEKIRRWELKEE